MFEEALIATKYALASGYSVQEISRCFITDTRSLYKVLTKEEVLPRLPHSLPKVKSLCVHPYLLNAISKTNLGFLQWCNSHRDLLGQDPAQISKALAGKLVRGELLSEISHLAVSRDFNNIYFDIYGVYLSDPLPWPSGLRIREKDSYVIAPQKSPISDTIMYFAHVVDNEDCEGTGETANKALARLQFYRLIKRAIGRLNGLPIRPKGFRG
jgi:hypothetical protein